MKGLLPLVLAMVFSLAPAVAQASIVASQDGNQLKLTSDNSGAVDETYTLRDEAAGVIVKTSDGLTGAAPPSCTVNVATDEVACPRNVYDGGVHIVAGVGVDTITDTRTLGPSLLEGGPGDDKITTTSGASSADMRGQAGLDKLTSASGNDTLDGGDDADTLTAVADKAFDSSDSGGPGNDLFVGNPDLEDELLAEAGGDTYNLGTHAGPGDPATLQRDSYADRVSYTFSTLPVTVRMDGIANDGRGGEQDNIGANVETIVGGSAGDLLAAGANGVTFIGGDGADQLLGGRGPDLLHGDSGNDILRGGDGDDELSDGDFTPIIITSPLAPGGNDVLDGGNGEDLLVSDRGADDLRGGPGFDRSVFSRPIPQAPSVTTPVVPARFTLSLDDVANDGQTAAGEGDNVHSDVEGIDTSGGADAITGSGAANVISTGSGNDVVDPGRGPDVVDLGPGADRVAAVDQATDIIRCGAGADAATADLPGAQAVRADALFDCESVTGTPFPAVRPAVDAARPVVTLSSKTIKSKTFLRKGRLAVTVRCNEACSARGEAYTRLARIARPGEFSLGTGRLALGTGKRTLRITVAKKYRTRFRSKLRTKAQKRRGLKFRVALTVQDAAGNVTNTSRTLRVKR